MIMHNTTNAISSSASLELVNDVRAKIFATHALHYKYPALVERVGRKLDLTPLESESLCVSLMEFLSLVAFTRGTSYAYLNPPHMIDAAWHEALLFTREYQSMCHQFFGAFIHHTPFTEYEKMMRRVQRERRFEAVDETIGLAQAVFGNLSKWWDSPNVAGVNMGDCDTSSTCGGSNDY